MAKSSSKFLYAIGGAFVALALVALFVIVDHISNPKQSDPSSEQTEQSSASQSSTNNAEQEKTKQRMQQFLWDELPLRQTDDPLAYGPVDAALVITEWSDYRCPHCADFNQNSLPSLLHFADEGKVRFEFRDMVIFGEQSSAAAVAARAAGQQGKFHEYQSALFKTTLDDASAAYDEAFFVDLAQQCGVADIEKFKNDLTNVDLQQKVVEQTTQASQQLGITSVPTFVIGGVAKEGSLSAEDFSKVIEEQLAIAEQRG